MNIGHVSAMAAFLMWGFLPIYWKQLEAVPSLQLVAHRIIWSMLTLLPIVIWSGRWSQFRAAACRPDMLARQLLAAVLVAANWLGFVWAVTHGRMIESSLGYFLTPLVSVLLGVLVLGERLRPLQWLAVTIAAVGVGWIAAGYHHLPWIALFLACTFSSYALAKKTIALDASASLTLETLLLLLPACGYLAFEHLTHDGSFGTLGAKTDLLIAACGPATAAPLLCFTVAARRIPLSTLGLLQYLGPTLQFLIGWWMYHEPFDGRRFIGFAIVWTALVIFAADGLLRRRGPSNGGPAEERTGPAAGRHPPKDDQDTPP